MQPQRLAALKRCALRITGHRATLVARFCARLDELAPGLGRRLEGTAGDTLATSWIEAARCADRWCNIEPLLYRAAKTLEQSGIGENEQMCLPESWVSAVEDTLGEALDHELRQGWHDMAARCLNTMHEASPAPA